MSAPEGTHVRKLAYAVLIAAAVGGAAGRILIPGGTGYLAPTQGDNDRSRWDTVRALVDHGTYVIGHRDRRPVAPSAAAPLAATDPLQALTLAAAAQKARLDGDTGISSEEGWRSIDKVLQPGTDDFYSSKPPLFSTLVAGLYWLLKHLLGWSIADNTWEVVLTILLLVNGLPFLIYLVLLARLTERFGSGDWGRLYVVTAAGFATLVTPFLTTLNNHTVATFALVFALYPAVQIWRAREEGVPAPAYRFVLAGFFAGLTACFELPAAAFTAALGLVLVVRAPTRTLALFVPAAAVPVAAFLVTNYVALGQLRPAYSEFGGPWYEYEGSHWSFPELKTGIDYARNIEGRGEYAFHVLIGHHGWFSLTPMWFFAVAGMIAGLAAARRPGSVEEAPGPRPGAPAFVYPLTLGVSVVVIGFYLVKSDNYGGWTNGLRWLMWLSPLWLLCMLPALDWLARRLWGRWLGYLFLAVSALTVSFAAWSPWRHPWLYRLLEWQGLMPY
jgi:hypothetical protein